MENPWGGFSMQDPYVAPEDALLLKSRRLRNERQRLQLHVLPEPYIGPFDAPIVFLKLNPGFTPNDIAFTNDPVARELWLANLLHREMEYPFYALNPQISWAENYGWWRKKIHFLTDIVPAQMVASNVQCIEYFPYHSYGKPSLDAILPSQRYNFYLVNEAIDRGAIIFLGNTVDRWFDAVPRLRDYQHCYVANSPQNAAISPGNYPAGFRHAIRVLQNR